MFQQLSGTSIRTVKDAAMPHFVLTGSREQVTTARQLVQQVLFTPQVIRIPASCKSRVVSRCRAEPGFPLIYRVLFNPDKTEVSLYVIGTSNDIMRARAYVNCLVHNEHAYVSYKAEIHTSVIPQPEINHITGLRETWRRKLSYHSGDTSTEFSNSAVENLHSLSQAAASVAMPGTNGDQRMRMTGASIADDGTMRRRLRPVLAM